MKVFVAGATGVLGRALVPRFLAAGHSVRAVARHTSAADFAAEVELISADLLEDNVFDLVRGCDAVVHIATAVPQEPLCPDNWEATARLRTAGTRRLLDASRACCVSRYVQQSIVMVYRDGGDAWLDEQAPLDHGLDRAAICGPVIEMESMIQDVRPQALAWTILRGGSFVGAGTSESALVDGLREGKVAVAGDGSNYVSPVTVADMACAVVVSLERAPAGSIFNIVDEPIRYGDYVDAIADLIGVPRPQRMTGRRLPPSWRCTNEAAQTALEWMPREPIWPYAATTTGNGPLAKKPAWNS
jgi:nucleoside-diphosphate-sugar epimerase